VDQQAAGIERDLESGEKGLDLTTQDRALFDKLGLRLAEAALMFHEEGVRHRSM